MRVFAIRLAGAAALALGACDGGPASTPHPLVGTWVSEADVQRTLVTSGRTQAVVDPHRPGTGGLHFTGAASGTLRYTGASTDDEGRPEFKVFSNDFHTHPFPPSYAFLSLRADGTALTVWHDGAYTQYSLRHYGGPAPYARADDRLVVDGVTLTSPGGATVWVSGALGLPTRTLDAGVEQEVERQYYAEEPDDRRERVFEPDGTYRESRPGDSRSPPFTGTWEALDGGRVRLRATLGETPAEAVFDYRLQDGALTLSDVWDLCANTPLQPCLSHYEPQFAMAPGSLRRVRQRREEVLVPG